MLKMIAREWRALWHDPWLLALVSYVPLLLALALWGLFSAAVPRQLPVALVDLDNTQLSRELGRQIEASPVSEAVSFHSENAAIDAMKRGRVFALVLIPSRFSAQLQSGKQPTLEIRYNGQFLLVGKLLHSSLQQSLAPALQALGRTQLLAHGVPAVQANLHISPLTFQITPLFNQSSNYVAFLMPPLFIALFQIVAMLIFVNALNRELDQPSYGHWLAHTRRNLTVKWLVYLPLAVLQSAVMMVLLYGYLGLPINGSFAWLILVQAVMLSAVFLWVCMIFFLLQDKARIVSFCTALFAPAFAFMGATFPVHEMPLLAQCWRVMMPSSFYIESQIAVVSYGLGGTEIAQELCRYLGFLLLLLPISGLIWLRKRSYRSQGLEEQA
ncbi:ABC transporter [Shewanella sp. NFH-SH190041]|uniref:ABC transporter permease n=1 Tax=Shewanella sp. NFH-SH190041 TaxID=2950245 RepID=UPI0021C3EB14|nr:ABC transporter permease [Shewanella sp. NFH-SH190041]BDM63112.1 ABC transporter [Shewanella sp. NFH-SH190041]